MEILFIITLLWVLAITGNEKQILTQMKYSSAPTEPQDTSTQGIPTDAEGEE